MAIWHHRLNENEFEQTLGDGEGQGNLACCSSRSGRVRHNWARTWHDTVHYDIK